MKEIRELLNIGRPTAIRELLRTCIMAETKRHAVECGNGSRKEEDIMPEALGLSPASDVAHRIRSLTAELSASIDRGSIAKVYADHATIRGICLLTPESGPFTSNTQHPTPDTRFTISRLLAEGNESEQIRIKTGLVQEILTDISGTRSLVAADLPITDRTGISALRQCGFRQQRTGSQEGIMPEASGLRPAEETWQTVLQSAGCTLHSANALKLLSPSALKPPPSPARLIVSLVKDLGAATTPADPTANRRRHAAN
jgi:hypothetical protein